MADHTALGPVRGVPDSSVFYLSTAVQNCVSKRSCKFLFRIISTDEYRLSNNRVPNID